MANKEDNQQQADTIETVAAANQAPNSKIQLQIDESTTPVTYSTTVRVWGSAEEFNLDFAGPLRPAGQNVARLKIDQRLVLNPWAAKRLAIALGQAVARYEATYGALELEEGKRRIAAPAAPAAPAAAATEAKADAAKQGNKK
ncbi:MAG: DUF3467 domain-containing protein [Phycisphaeraceae bacterium]|nr:DUF3467 domain-containing protein [Phycisphaeraceae bacterium]